MHSIDKQLGRGTLGLSGSNTAQFREISWSWNVPHGSLETWNKTRNLPLQINVVQSRCKRSASLSFDRNEAILDKATSARCTIFEIHRRAQAGVLAGSFLYIRYLLCLEYFQSSTGDEYHSILTVDHAIPISVAHLVFD